MISPFEQWRPQIEMGVFIASSAEVIGQVTIGEYSSIWHQSVLRGDVEAIHIGARTNIQEHCTLHTSYQRTPCVIGDDVTVGHRVILHGCEIQSNCLVGMGSIIMDQAVMECGSLLAAGSLVTEGKILKSGFLYAGSPAKEIRPLKAKEREFLLISAKRYMELAQKYHQEES
ncbi:MAG: gamma carbonic anhydrase family protein [Zetaproteobacteria bacterium]|nr:gamma carbonic anhydrase family protein [Zetaproteobacteria bacterium]